jgi:gliding motility-associated-like protein
MFVSVYGNAQCTTIGQTPSTAFPVCGIDTFTQQSVPLCSSHSIIVPGCPEADGYSDKNPFWYTFTCYVSGTLGFLITPNDLGDDYDWQLYDITNHLPSDVFTDSSLVVTGNWCGTYGLTGASDTGVDFIQCASVPQQNLSAFSAMPNLIAGHKYLLLISHFTDSQSGYQLTFGGGTCSITDPNIPSLKNVQAECNRSVIGIKISKDVRCNSLASDGSDFSISTPLASIISATGVNCNNEFDLDSVLLILSNPLPPGNYSITAKIGSDGNTLLDDCHNSLPVGDQFSFTVLPVISSAFTYQIFYGCKSDSIQFTNPGGNGITKWQWTFDSAFQSISQSPFFIDTIYGLNTAQLIVSNGVCNDTSTASFSLDNELKSIFTAPDNVCPTDKATFENNSIGNVTAWYWDFGDGTYSTDSVPEPHMFPSTLHDAKYTVRLILENSAGCYDTSSHVITRVQSCYIAVPSGFTPNGDGINDYLYPLNAYKAINLEFRVYNRYGQLVFETKNWMNKWDGTINGKQQPTGTYVWMLNYTDSDSGKKYFLKGTSVLIR